MHKIRLKDKLFADLIFRCIKCHKPQAQLSNLTKDFWIWRVEFWGDCGTESPGLSMVTHRTVIMLHVCNTFVVVLNLKWELQYTCVFWERGHDLISRRTALWFVKMVSCGSPAISSFTLPHISLPCFSSKISGSAWVSPSDNWISSVKVSLALPALHSAHPTPVNHIQQITAPTCVLLLFVSCSGIAGRSDCGRGMSWEWGTWIAVSKGEWWTQADFCRASPHGTRGEQDSAQPSWSSHRVPNKVHADQMGLQLGAGQERSSSQAGWGLG